MAERSDRAYTSTSEYPNRRRRRSSSSESGSSMLPAKVKRSSETLTTGDLMEIIQPLLNASSDILYTTSIISEFDPDNNVQDIERWLRKVNECAIFYNWDEKQTIHFSLEKLRGLAKTWYESLSSINYSWPEWQCKMRKAFPNKENFAKLLDEMLSRKYSSDETLKDYFYDKLALLNSCNISGRKAVDCIIHGITDVSVRNRAKAIKCSDPEDLLNYLASQQFNRTKDYWRNTF